MAGTQRHGGQVRGYESPHGWRALRREAPSRQTPFTVWGKPATVYSCPYYYSSSSFHSSCFNLHPRNSLYSSHTHTRDTHITHTLMQYIKHQASSIAPAAKPIRVCRSSSLLRRLYSLGTPNGHKVTILLEELGARGLVYVPFLVFSFSFPPCHSVSTPTHFQSISNTFTSRTFHFFNPPPPPLHSDHRNCPVYATVYVHHARVRPSLKKLNASRAACMI